MPVDEAATAVDEAGQHRQHYLGFGDRRRHLRASTHTAPWVGSLQNKQMRRKVQAPGK
jgi:hypothetical protein